MNTTTYQVFMWDHKTATTDKLGPPWSTKDQAIACVVKARAQYTSDRFWIKDDMGHDIDVEGTTMNTATLATLVKETCKDAPKAAWFNNDPSSHKVWIHAAFALTGLVNSGMTLDGFKMALTAASQARTLDLSRCDMVEACDPYDVRRSATFRMGAEFNFIRID